ncbi:hypothetical protein AB1K70_03450 [Bremerella sp. JC770]|uniref:hypothetical protein n=1 Tax=Bremerella sp. JC770 TaxID=3232137 RepID=UPI00345A80FB
MQQGIDGNKLAITGGLQNANWMISAAVQGNHRGQAVTVMPGGSSSSLQDSVEELTFTLQDSQSKKLAERSTQSKSFSARLHALLAKYVTALPESLSPDELNQYADWLRKQSQPSSSELKHLLEEGFGDDTEGQVAALEFLEELFSAEDHPAALAAVRDLKQAWSNDDSHGPLLKAADNIHANTLDFEGELDSDFGLLVFYRTTVLSWSDIDDAYTSILNQYGSDFEKATEFLFQALGSEIQSMGPSCDPRMLSAVRDDIYYLQVVHRFYKQMEDLQQRMKKTFGLALCNPRNKSKTRKRLSGKSSR